ASWQRGITREGAWLPADVRTLYEQVLAHLPSYRERYLCPRFETSHHLTLSHGDACFANYLCPRPPATGPTYLFAWQSPAADIPGYDLANLLATFWTLRQRRAGRREQRILRRCHATLRTHGVGEYTWGDPLADYRHSLIYWLLVPILDAADGARKDYWWPK